MECEDPELKIAMKKLKMCQQQKRASHINNNGDNNNSINITDVKNSMSTPAQYLKQGDCLSRRK